MLMAALCLVPKDWAHAQSLLSGGTIEEIRIEGSQRIDPQTVHRPGASA